MADSKKWTSASRKYIKAIKINTTFFMNLDIKDLFATCATNKSR